MVKNATPHPKRIAKISDDIACGICSATNRELIEVVKFWKAEHNKMKQRLRIASLSAISLGLQIGHPE